MFSMWFTSAPLTKPVNCIYGALITSYLPVKYFPVAQILLGVRWGHNCRDCIWCTLERKLLGRVCRLTPYLSPWLLPTPPFLSFLPSYPPLRLFLRVTWSRLCWMPGPFFCRVLACPRSAYYAQNMCSGPTPWLKIAGLEPILRLICCHFQHPLWLILWSKEAKWIIWTTLWSFITPHHARHTFGSHISLHGAKVLMR